MSVHLDPNAGLFVRCDGPGCNLETTPVSISPVWLGWLVDEVREISLCPECRVKVDAIDEDGSS